jgi:hypothetical protein
VIRAVALVAVISCALAVGVAAPGAATRECAGLQICVPVVGPWVVVPTAAASARPQTEFVLSCPKGFIVGGLDAELSTRGIDISFDGRLGSPVNPGITTARDAVFRATQTGAAAPRGSFRPHLGCIPAQGGGSPRPPTALRYSLASSRAVFPPAQATVRHVRNIRLQPGREQHVAVACAKSERLVGASRAFGFATLRPPSAALAGSVGTSLATGANRAVVTVRNSLPPGARALVQVVAICAGGK